MVSALTLFIPWFLGGWTISYSPLVYYIFTHKVISSVDLGELVFWILFTICGSVSLEHAAISQTSQGGSKIQSYNNYDSTLSMEQYSGAVICKEKSTDCHGTKKLEKRNNAEIGRFDSWSSTRNCNVAHMNLDSKLYMPVRRQSMEFCQSKSSGTNHAKHSFTIISTIALLGFFFGHSVRTLISSVLNGGSDIYFFVSSQIHILLLIVFHSSEYLFVCQFHPLHCSWHAFLFNNGIAYTLCLLGSTIECHVWYSVYTSLIRPQAQKILLYSGSPLRLSVLGLGNSFCFLGSLGLRTIGFIVSLFGLILRITAFLTAQSNFTHTIARTKRPGFQLVTSGVYRYCRHPSYFGWFLWALGSQLLLLNPICLYIYLILSTKFFCERIAYEEKYLRQIFGIEYYIYSYRTPIWIPSVQSYLNELRNRQNWNGGLRIQN